jgi:hypothetical protein
MKLIVQKIYGKQLMTIRSKYVRNVDARTVKSPYQKWRLFNEVNS